MYVYRVFMARRAIPMIAFPRVRTILFPGKRVSVFLWTSLLMSLGGFLPNQLLLYIIYIYVCGHLRDYALYM